VLGGFVDALVLFHNKTYASSLTAKSFHSYQFSRVWGGNEEQSAEKVGEICQLGDFLSLRSALRIPCSMQMRRFFESVEFSELRPLSGAFETLREHAGHCTFVVVTSRQHFIAEQTRAWLSAHFPGVIEDVVFGNHWAESGLKR
jgi:hypothetical protein